MCGGRGRRGVRARALDTGRDRRGAVAGGQRGRRQRVRQCRRVARRRHRALGERVGLPGLTAVPRAPSAAGQRRGTGPLAARARPIALQQRTSRVLARAQLAALVPAARRRPPRAHQHVPTRAAHLLSPRPALCMLGG